MRIQAGDVIQFNNTQNLENPEQFTVIWVNSNRHDSSIELRDANNKTAYYISRFHELWGDEGKQTFHTEYQIQLVTRGKQQENKTIAKVNPHSWDIPVL